MDTTQVAYPMFDRWRQKYVAQWLREESAGAALVEYAAVPDNATREVPNPAGKGARKVLSPLLQGRRVPA